MSIIFGPKKTSEYVSFPSDWIKPGEFNCNSAEYFSDEQKILRDQLAMERRDGQKLPPIFWMK